MEAVRDSIGECIGCPCTAHNCNGRAVSITNSESQPKLVVSIPSPSSSSQSSDGNFSNTPPFSPTGEFFKEALSDPEKEAMIIYYLDSKYHTTFEFIKKVGVSMQLGLPRSDYEFIKILMHAAV